MSGPNKAFGRSLPREMQEAREHMLQETGQLELLQRPTPLWKINDDKAGKNGPCQAVYWVRERPAALQLSRHAKQEKQWSTGTVYKGEWKKNLKHGYGIQIWASGNKYEGEWAHGGREGHGVLWVRDKSALKKKEEEAKSSGSRPSSKKGGSSSAQPKLRRVYAGNWRNDAKDGEGVYFYSDGSRYEGQWESDQRSGRGTLYACNGDVYTGEWKQGLQNGFGTLTKANQDVYEGEWLNGLREGSGIYYYKSQEKIYDGEWVNDQPKCGVYCDAKEFFDDDAEERRYAQASGEAAPAGADPSEALSAAAVAGDPRLHSPRFPRNRTGMPIPRLRMQDADGVLAAQIEAIALERAPMRALPHVLLSELFNEESLDALRRLFASFDADPQTGDGSGMIQLRHLPALLTELTLPQLDPPQLAQLLTDLRVKDAKERINFQTFVRAVHFCEEAKNLQQMKQQQEEENQ